MFKSYFFKNFLKTILITIFLVIFSTVVILTNHSNLTNEDSFNDLNFLFKLILQLFIPLYGNFSYLYSYLLVYIVPVILIYTYYLATSPNSENYLFLAHKRNFLNRQKILADTLNLSIIVGVLLLSLSLTTYFTYNLFYLDLLTGFSLLIILMVNLYLVKTTFVHSKLLLGLTAIISLVIYAIYHFTNLKFLYYLSLLDLGITPTSNFSIIIFPSILLICLLLIKKLGKEKRL